MHKDIKYTSTSKIAREHNIKASPYLFDYLISLGLLIKEHKKYKLTKQGVELGAIYQKNNNNESWVAWKEYSLDNIINNLKKKLISENKIITTKMLIVDRLEYEPSCMDESAYVILCFTQGNENYYYEFNKILENEDKARELVEKIEKKGIIDPEYWSEIDMGEYYLRDDKNDNYFDEEGV